jgi:hypothetical protein
MTKVRIGHEDVFIAKTYHKNPLTGMFIQDPIPDKYHFHFDSKWVSNISNTKRIAVRKIKVYPMTFVFEAIIGYVDDIHVPQRMYKYFISHSLSEKDSILDILDYFCEKVNNFVNIDYPNINYTINYSYNRGYVLFQSTFPPELQFRFVLKEHALRIFNVDQDPGNPGFSVEYPLNDDSQNVPATFQGF